MEAAACARPQPAAPIADFIADYRKMIACDGIAVWSDGHITLSGETPTESEVKDLVAFINRTSPGRICASAEIAKVYAAGESFRDRAAGFLAIPISRMPRDCLIFFRREILRSVNWAGDPNKAYASGPARPAADAAQEFRAVAGDRSRGQSAPWIAADLRIAESLRVTLLEVILQLADLAARERRGAQERQELMIAELNHRVRNILSLVRGLVAQSKDTATSRRGIRQRARRPHPGAGARARPDHQPELGAGRAAVAGGIRGRRLSRRARRPRPHGRARCRARSQGVRDAWRSSSTR